MLPAVSAELPAYLVPPAVNASPRTANTAQGYGPAAVAEISADAVRAAQSRRPGVGLYGPNGRFIESTAGRHAGARTTRQPTPQAADGDRSGGGAPTEDLANAAVASTESSIARKRDLSLAQVNAVVPPAHQDELRELADHVRRTTDVRRLEARDYERIADLMERVGDYDQAKQALDEARKLKTQESGH